MLIQLPFSPLPRVVFLCSFFRFSLRGAAREREPDTHQHRAQASDSPRATHLRTSGEDGYTHPVRFSHFACPLLRFLFLRLVVCLCVASHLLLSAPPHLPCRSLDGVLSFPFRLLLLRHKRKFAARRWGAQIASPPVLSQGEEKLKKPE